MLTNLNSIKFLFKKVITPNKKQFVVIFLLFFFSSLFGMLAILFIGKFFDIITSSNNTQLNYKWALPLMYFFILQITSFSLEYLASRRTEILNVQNYNNLFTKIMKKILNMPMSEYKERKSGELWELIDKGISSGAVIVKEMSFIVPQLFIMIVGFAIVFFINKLFFTFFLVLFVIYLIVILKDIRKINNILNNQFRYYARAWGFIWEKYINIKSVKLASFIDKEVSQLKKYLIKGGYFWNKKEFIWMKIGFLQKISTLIMQILIFSLSVYLIYQRQLTIGELIVVNSYSMFILGPLASLASQSASLQTNIKRLKDLDDLIAKLPQENEDAGKKKIKIKGEIEFKDVWFKYDKKEDYILKGVSFKIKPKEKVALVGESGVGKTTIADLIAAFYFPEKGDVKIDGASTKGLDVYYLRKQIAFVPQEVILFHDTIKNNITYGVEKVSEKEFKNIIKKVALEEFINKLPQKHNQIVGELGIKLSSGQKQRIAIARALLKKPKILILDEPTSNLDAKTEKVLTENLNELMQNSTTIIIAHRLSTIKKCDKILVLHNGKIVEEGTHDQLIKDSKVYKEFYDIQFSDN